MCLQASSPFGVLKSTFVNTVSYSFAPGRGSEALDHGITRIVDAGGQTIGDRQPALDLAQNQQTAIRGQTAAVEAGDDLFAANR